MVHFRKLLAAEAATTEAASTAARTHIRISELLLVIGAAVSLLVYLILKLLSATLVLLNIVEYPLAQLLMPILVIKEALSRIIIVHQLIVLRSNKLHVFILTSNIYHFLLFLFSLFSFLHTLYCFPCYAVADGLATPTKYWEWVQPRVVSEDLLQVVVWVDVVVTLERLALLF